RKKGMQKNLKGNWLQIIRQKEALKLDIVRDQIVPRLHKITGQFPDVTIMSSFYQKLMKLTLDVDLMRRALATVDWGMKQVKKLQKTYVSQIFKEKEREEIKGITKKFYGRVSSVVKQLDPAFEDLERFRKIMLTYPDIKDLYTVCLYGFPNVGKTTLLNNLTGTKAKIAAYAFTTKSINAGYIGRGEEKIQVLDVPGTLARKDTMNKIELQAELVIDEVADMTIYVFDLSEYCGISVEEQVQLYDKIKKKKDVLVYLSKKDLLSDEIVSSFKEKHYSVEELQDLLQKIQKEREDENIKKD
ncbi:TPA: GTP-binding protein, partial [Candidatus Woesearchaeota archaeon]|nr:GTP-binding protein [Candidatus Woesearchaeota archaeon]